MIPLHETLETQRTLFIDLGAAYFALLMYWIFSLWKDLASSQIRSWIGFALAAGMAFGVVASFEWGVAAAGTAFAIGLCLGMAFLHPAAAVALLTSSLFLRPWELIEQDPYLGLLPRFSFALCLGHWVLQVAQQKKLAIARSRVGVVLAVFAFWCFLCTLFAPPDAGALGEFVNGLAKSIFLYFALVEMVRDEKTFRVTVGTLLLSFLFVGLVSLMQTEGDLRLKGFGAFQNSNDIAALMVLILPFAVTTFRRRSRQVGEGPWMRLAALALSLVSVTAVILSRSRGAMLGLFAMLAAYAILRYGKRVWLPLGAGMALLALPAMSVLSGRSSTDLEQSSAGRMTYLKAGLRMGIKNPVFGVGFNAYPVNLQNYNTESLDEGKQMTAHNSWVLVFAETGFFGLFLFSAAFFGCMLAAYRLYPTEPELLMSMTGYGVTMIFLSHSYLIYPYLLYALVQSAHRFRTGALA